MSLTQINFSSKSKSVQIIINVFMDDIETALNKDYDIDLQLTTEKELKENDVYFEKYLNEKLHFKVNTIDKKFNYIGKEYEGELVYFYLEIENINAVDQITISNKILVKHFPKQENLIKSKVGKVNKSVLLDAENYSETLKY
ncbi:MAG: hypothetical protein HON97_06060 [Polaribacter sp.]|nr:hypothetical protein [Polaribacter sp.]MBT5099787.1 hypothetical protein [Polaribacter sp.]MBT7703927.1 hypothetical protein [Polaribacter sp.]